MHTLPALKIDKTTSHEPLRLGSCDGVTLGQRSGYPLGGKCPISLRRIRFIRLEDEKEIVLVSNDLTSPAEEIMVLYKQHWQIELFFKWIKQNLKIKRFLGTSEHAIHLQVLSAMIAYLLLKLVNNSLSTLQASLQQLTRLISANLFQRKSVIELITSTNQKQKPLKTRQFAQLELQFS